ncbi:MAG: DUF1731 domain-containing protein [Thermoanaerobaculales bacterium]
MPAFAARLALGEMADALLLASAQVRPKAFENAGFVFRSPSLENAIRRALAPTLTGCGELPDKQPERTEK